MANVIVEVSKPITDGSKLKFRTPCDSATIEFLEVKYPAKNGVGTLVKKFVFKDAHGAVLSGVGNLFVGGVMIEVLLDVTHGVAYIKNADTNSYVESVKSDIQRLEEAQRQFLVSASGIVERCENIATSAEGFTQVMSDATERAGSVRGVYVGSGEMPEAFNVQIDPDGDVLVMDTALNSESVNPVENKVITAALATKADKTDMDDKLEQKADVTMTVHTYKRLGYIGITVGETSGESAETIENIATKLKGTGKYNTMLLYGVDSNNANIYPLTSESNSYGVARVTYLDEYRVLFEYFDKVKGKSWVGVHSKLTDGGYSWTGWVRNATNSDITALEKKISEIGVSSLVGDIADLEGKVGNLEVLVPNTERALEIVIGEVSTLEEKVKLLESKVKVLEGKH